MSLFTDATVVFPDNAIELIWTRFRDLYEPDLTVLRRPLRSTDGSQSVGIHGTDWVPDETSWEFSSKEPTVQRYLIRVQGLCKESDQEKGIKIHSVMAKAIRSLLYNDAPLQVGLNLLSVTMNGATERIQRRGVTRQKYLSNEINGTFVYVSSLELYIETETK